MQRPRIRAQGCWGSGDARGQDLGHRGLGLGYQGCWGSGDAGGWVLGCRGPGTLRLRLSLPACPHPPPRPVPAACLSTAPSAKNTHSRLPPGTGSDHPNSAVLHLKGLHSAPWFKCRASKWESVLIRVSSCPMGAREPGVPGGWSTWSTSARTRIVVMARG